MANFVSSIPPITRHLLIINVIVWALVSFIPDVASAVQNYGALYYFSNPRFNPAQLFTYMFVHFDFFHLFFNMFALFVFGGLIERTLGSNKFLFYYIACGIGAALIQEGVFAVMINHYSGQLAEQAQMLLPQGVSVPGYLDQLFENAIFYDLPAFKAIAEFVYTPAVGASGAIFGVLIAVAMIYPNIEMYIMFIPVPIKAKWVVLGYAVIELTQAVSPRMGDNVAHWAHLGGLLVGMLIILYWRRKIKQRYDRVY